MSIKRRLANWLLDTKDPVVSAALLDALKAQQAQWYTGASYESMAKEGYLGNPYVYACANYIANAVAGITWQAKTGHGTADESALDKHPLIDLLTRPNPQQGRTRFFRETMLYKMVGGNAYIMRVGPVDITRPPLELYNLRPDMVKPISDGTLQGIKHYERDLGNGRKEQIKPELILHLDDFDPLAQLTGPSPMQPGAKSVDQNNESRGHNVKLLQNGARLSGVLSTEQPMSEAEHTRMSDLIRERFGGSKKAGEILLAAGGLKWQDMGISPKDMDWLEGMKLSAREIAIVYAVPPELVGDSSNKTYSNYQEARQAFYQETILPVLDYLRDELNNWLVPLYGDGIYLDYNSDDIEALQEDRDKVHTRVQKDYTSGIITRNEARDMLGLEPDTSDPESDTFRKPTPVVGKPGDDTEDDTDAGKSGKKALDGKLPPMTAEEAAFASVMELYFGQLADDVVSRIENS